VRKAADALAGELTEDIKRYQGEQAAAFRGVHMMLREDLTAARKTG
jgi:hypothetical protein